MVPPLLGTAHAAYGSEALLQALRRGTNSADEPSPVAELAGCDGDGAGEEGGKRALDPLVELGTHADASPEHNDLQIEQRLQCHDGKGDPSRRRVEHGSRYCVAFLQEPAYVAHGFDAGAALAAVSVNNGE